jgi:hypothetical protein
MLSRTFNQGVGVSIPPWLSGKIKASGVGSLFLYLFLLQLYCNRLWIAVFLLGSLNFKITPYSSCRKQPHLHRLSDEV